MTTELEAVNQILATIGESPINSLTGDKPLDASLALTTLREVSRQLQSIGWSFNTEDCYPLPRDGDNKIPLPVNTLRIKIRTGDYTNITPVHRGAFLYDRQNRTDIFDQTITLETIVFELSFEETPEAFRKWVTVRAAQLFASRSLGSQVIFSYTEKDLIDAKRDFTQAELEAEDVGMDFSDVNLSVMRGRIQ